MNLEEDLKWSCTFSYIPETNVTLYVHYTGINFFLKIKTLKKKPSTFTQPKVHLWHMGEERVRMIWEQRQ